MYRISNVKWKNGKCIGVFDLDWSKEDYRLADIGYSLVISIAAWEALKDGEMDMERVKAICRDITTIPKNMEFFPSLRKVRKKPFPILF